MTVKELETLASGLFEEEIKILTQKGKDYSGENDTLFHLKQDAEQIGVTKYQVWAVLAAKGFNSIFNSIKSSPEHPQVESEPLKERIKDARNYLALLWALLSEDKDTTWP